MNVLSLKEAETQFTNFINVPCILVTLKPRELKDKTGKVIRTYYEEGQRMAGICKIHNDMGRPKLNVNNFITTFITNVEKQTDNEIVFSTATFNYKLMLQESKEAPKEDLSDEEQEEVNE